MTDPIKTLNAPEFIDLLRAVNPHIPDNDLITQDTLTVTLGVNEVAVLNLSIFITLPDWDKLLKVQQEDYPLLTVDELVAEAREFHESETAWTLNGQAVTVDITHIDEETRDG